VYSRESHTAFFNDRSVFEDSGSATATFCPVPFVFFEKTSPIGQLKLTTDMILHILVDQGDFFFAFSTHSQGNNSRLSDLNSVNRV
jgi:hypothetical protein